jgi:alpha-tubulin suppressor-like RCC1 family protein
VSCWGRNNEGQLGDNTVLSRSTPDAVVGFPAGVRVTQVSTGAYHTCALSSAGAVYCWGSNSHGQLGNGNTTDQRKPVQVVGLPAGVTVTQVGAGSYHTCALSSGAVYCWGYNYYGQLGDGTTTAPTAPYYRQSPTAVDTSGALAGVTVSQISVGGQHSCAVSSAGAVYCWGYNGFGQVGNGTTANQSTPVAVGGALAGVTVSQVSVGENHTCAVSAGALYCWGHNGSGQLGDGTLTSRPSPVAVAGGVLAGVTVTQVSAGSEYTCAASAAGAGSCWGRNEFGQLGDGSTTDRPRPVAVNVVALTAPQAPTGVTATAGNAQATVSWTAPASLGSGTLTGYTATADPGGKTCTSTAATSCTVSGLTNGTKYRFTVVTRTTAGESTPSALSAPITPYAPGPPPLPGQEPSGDAPLTSSQGAAFTSTSRTTRLTGTGFAANIEVTVGIYSTPQLLTTTVSDSTGAIDVEVTIPAGYTGAHTLVAIGLSPDHTLRTLTLPITIAAAPASTGPTSSAGGLAVTGSAITALIALGVGLLAVGTAAVIVVRRRRPRFAAGATDGLGLD